VEDNSRMFLRIRAEEEAPLMRAVALKHTHRPDRFCPSSRRARRQGGHRAGGPWGTRIDGCP
jgi:hypothetical protein